MAPIYLEEWLQNIISGKNKKFKKKQGDLNHPNNVRLKRADVEAYQLEELRKTLIYARKNSTFYKQVFKNHNIDPLKIKNLSDLAQIPMTNQSDLALNPNRFLCVSHSDISKVTTFTTSGTTGPQKRVFCTQADVERITDFMGAALRTVAGEKDFIHIILPSGVSNNQADLLSQGLQKQGINSIIAGMNISAKEQLKLIEQHKPTVLLGVTSRIYRLTQELKQYRRLDNLSVKKVFVTSGYLSESMRDQLKSCWMADVHNHYGMTEMGLGFAVECHSHHGYHFNEADLIVEIIDPETGMPIEEGEGELVFTTLRREGMPLIRYRTHDISRWVSQSCPCGADSLRKIGKVSKRLESGVKFGPEDEIFFSQFDGPLYRIKELVDYQIEVIKSDGKDRMEFVFEVTRKGRDLQDTLKTTICDMPVMRKNLSAGNVREPVINIVEIGAFNAWGRAKKKISDNRSFGEVINEHFSFVE